jgi:hypothetical protein
MTSPSAIQITLKTNNHKQKSKYPDNIQCGFIIQIVHANLGPQATANMSGVKQLLESTEVHHRTHNSPPLGRILKQLNSVHTFTPLLLRFI